LLQGKEDFTEGEYSEALKKAREICDKERLAVLEAGGLHIIGTERHESRRVDNQLRGRSGRQGDPGSTRFYLSLEDDLMRIFGSDRISGMMSLLKMDESIPIENKMVTKAIENAQKKVEAHNFDIRKHLLEYDDVMNKQRTEIYKFRREVLQGEALKEKIFEMMENEVDGLMSVYCPDADDSYEWDLKGLGEALYGIFDVRIGLEKIDHVDGLGGHITDLLKEAYGRKEVEAGPELMRYMEKVILLQVIDNQWKDHLLGIDHMKEGIGLRGYAQKDPLVEYKKEAFELFSGMSERISVEVLTRLFKMKVRQETEREVRPKEQRLIFNRSDEGPQQPVHREKKVGRNDPCPCGSGKKHKKCCGAK
jgi:preprotein translocase subunit SecA